MPQYVAIGNHAPSECPGANGRVRDAWKKVVADAPSFHNKHQVKLVLGPVHLDPSHQVLAVVEAANQDAVQDFLIASRLGQIQDMSLYRGTDLGALFAQAEGSMPPLYP